MLMIRRWAVLTVLVIAAMATMMLTRCSQPPMPPEEAEELAVSPLVEDEPGDIEPELIEEAEDVIVTSADVRGALLDQFDERWPEKARRQTLDVSIQLFQMAEEHEVDPIIMADEYMDLLQTTLNLQPIFEKGWDGGVTRAMLITLDIYRGTWEVRGLSCHEIDEDRFDAELGHSGVERVNPYVLLSIGYRESRLAKRTELGMKLGGGGERGMFQFRPHKSGRKGFIEARFMPRYKQTGGTRERCSPFDRMCATRGAANALAWIRCDCIRQFGERCNIDTYVAGYGLPHLPDPSEARHSRGPRNARRFLCTVREDCDDLWPTDNSDDFAATL